jgi:hypothetical protein
MATTPDDDPTLVLTEDERAERARIITALSASEGSTARAASSLGIFATHADREDRPLSAPETSQARSDRRATRGASSNPRRAREREAD